MATMTNAEPPAGRDPILALILLGALGLNLHHLDHPGLHYFDESFHAIVARNLVKHPLTPTLIDDPVLPYDPTQWGSNHVWLHKPVVPLWGMAAAMAVFGVNTGALRLPSALLAVGAVGLTYLIGRRLFDRPTALIAAFVQAINPAIELLVQGHLFGDHVDVALLFWVEAGAYAIVRGMGSGSMGWAVVAGIAQGLAYLSKSYLGLLLTGLATVVWLLPRLGMAPAGGDRLRGRHVATLLGTSILTAAPWMIHCARSFPAEFAHEHGYVFTHLNQGVENWGGPWDRVVFDYWITLYHGFYLPTLVAAGVMAGLAVARRASPLWVPLAWAGGAIAPHLVAATKTPSATLIALPAAFLILARWVVEGWRGHRWALVSWAAVALVEALRAPTIGRFGRGWSSPPRAFGVMLQATWVGEHLALILVAAGAIALLVRWVRWGRLDRWVRLAATVASVAIALRVAAAAWAATEVSEARPFIQELAAEVRDHLPLPPRAVLLLDGPDRGDHQLAMFLLDRTCYPTLGRSPNDLARQVAERGGVPFRVTMPGAPEVPGWHRRYTGRAEARSLDEWRPGGP